MGYDFIYSAIDAHSPLAFSESSPTSGGPHVRPLGAEPELLRPPRHRKSMLSDNAENYLDHDFTRAVGDIEHRTSRFRRRQISPEVHRRTNGWKELV